MLRNDLDPFLSRAALPPGWQIVYQPVVASTNDLAREAAQRDWPERVVFVADYQTRGRGRQGRTWVARPGSGLLMSVLFRNSGEAPQRFTMLASVAACEAIEAALGIAVTIKWPNDLMVDDRKVAGVLAEAVSTGSDSGYVVVGMGVNVNLEPDHLAHLPASATALNQAVGRPVHRGELLVGTIERMDAWLELPSDARGSGLWAEWHRRLWGRHQTLRIQEQDRVIEAVVEGAEPDGRLIVRTLDGQLRKVMVGEIIL